MCVVVDTPPIIMTGRWSTGIDAFIRAARFQRPLAVDSDISLNVVCVEADVSDAADKRTRLVCGIGRVTCDRKGTNIMMSYFYYFIVSYSELVTN